MNGYKFWMISPWCELNIDHCWIYRRCVWDTLQLDIPNAFQFIIYLEMINSLFYFIELAVKQKKKKCSKLFFSIQFNWVFAILKEFQIEWCNVKESVNFFRSVSFLGNDYETTSLAKFYCFKNKKQNETNQCRFNRQQINKKRTCVLSNFTYKWIMWNKSTWISLLMKMQWTIAAWAYFMQWKKTNFV